MISILDIGNKVFFNILIFIYIKLNIYYKKKERNILLIFLCVLHNIESIEPLTKLVTSYEPTKQSMYIILQRCRKIETYDEIIKRFNESYGDRYELSFDIGAV